MPKCLISLLCLISLIGICLTSIQLPSLPLEHYKYWFANNKNISNYVREICLENKLDHIRFDSLNQDLDVKSLLSQLCSQQRKAATSCWGYEDADCKVDYLYHELQCPGDSKGWARNKIEQKKVFFEQADFGYIREMKKELKYYCKPKKTLEEASSNSSIISSSLECVKHFRFCRAKNIMIDFENLATIEEPMRYRDDVIKQNQIGGWNCELDELAVREENGHKSPLQSWYSELEHFSVFKDDMHQSCDIWLEKPTFIMKLDATVNMYHHFCDFINLYVSLHLNNSFVTDNHILIWDTYPYRSNFGTIWKAFTKNNILDLNKFRKKKVCFRDVVFPLLPRMIFGIYYNMPLIPGCSQSALFKAFNRHLLHKLNLNQPKLSHELKITLISRQTKFRRILNEEELMLALKSKYSNYKIEKYDFSHSMSFIDQIKLSSSSDMIIGMHGAGLTHVLFQPDWGVLFELYNCDDSDCYLDLARLRGVKYLTWKDKSKVFAEDEGQHPDLGAHAKFTNYRFDVPEFIRLVSIGVKHILKEKEKCNQSFNHSEHHEL